MNEFYVDDVKYVDWVELVFHSVVGQMPMTGSRTGTGLFIHLLKIEASVPEDEMQLAQKGLDQALADLKEILAIDASASFIKLTQRGRQLADSGSLQALWPLCFEGYLTADQEDFLLAGVELSEDARPTYAHLHRVPYRDLFQKLGWEIDIGRAYAIADQMEEQGFLRKKAAFGDFLEVWPTYSGVVRATEHEQTGAQSLLVTLLEEWETASTEVKSRLDLEKAQGKAKLVKSLLALATTKLSGRRFLILGFDNNSRRFTHPLDAGLTQERVENLLHAYAEPAPQIRLTRVARVGGDAALIEAIRETEKVPYRISKAVGDLRVGDVYVRHGTHSEPPTPAELESLIDEGATARGKRDPERDGAPP